MRSHERIQAICEELGELARQAVTIQTKYSAYFNLHSAAALDRDKELLREHRASLHVLLDQLLDNGERIQVLNDELSSLQKIP